MHIHTAPLFQVELEKDSWEYVDIVLWCSVPRTLDYPTIKLNPPKGAPWSQCQTDGQTDEHHGNSATIRSNERIRAKKQSTANLDRCVDCVKVLIRSRLGGLKSEEPIRIVVGKKNTKKEQIERPY